MSEDFIKRMDDHYQHLKSMYEPEKESLDVSEELDELLKVYKEKETFLLSEENNVLNMMSHFMEKYLEVRNKRKEVTEKKLNLLDKMDCAEGEDE